MEYGINKLYLIILGAHNGTVFELSGVIVLMNHKVYCIFYGRKGLYDLLMGKGDILFYTLFHCLRIFFKQNPTAKCLAIVVRLIVLLSIFYAL